VDQAILLVDLASVGDSGSISSANRTLLPSIIFVLIFPLLGKGRGSVDVWAINRLANGVLNGVAGVVDICANALALAARFEGVFRYPGVGKGVCVIKSAGETNSLARRTESKFGHSGASSSGWGVFPSVPAIADLDICLEFRRTLSVSSQCRNILLKCFRRLRSPRASAVSRLALI